MAQMHIAKCGICSVNNGCMFCYECNEALCMTCQIVHEKLPTSKTHSVIDITKVDRLVYKSENQCADHKEQFISFCTGCECLICHVCLSSTHNGHNFSGIDVASKDARKVLDEAINKGKSTLLQLETMISDIKSELVKLEEERNAKIENIQTTSKVVEGLIPVVKETHVNDVDAFIHGEKETQKMTLRAAEKRHREYEDVVRSFEQIQKITHDTTYLGVYFMQKNDLLKLDDIPLHDKPAPQEEFVAIDFFSDVVTKINESDVLEKEKRQIAYLAAKVQPLQDENQRANEQHQEDKKQIDALKAEIEQLQTEKQRDYIEKMKKEINELKDGMNSIAEDKKRLVKKLTALRLVRERAKEQHHENKMEIDHLKAEVKQLYEEKQRATKQHHENEVKVDHLKAEVKQLHEEKQRATKQHHEEIGDLKAKLQTEKQRVTKQHHKEIDDMKAKLQTEKQRATKQDHENKMEIDHLKAEVKQLYEEKQRVTKQHHENETKIDHLKAEVKQLYKEKQRVTKQHHEEIDDLKAKLQTEKQRAKEQYHEEINDLKAKLQTEKQRAAKQDHENEKKIGQLKAEIKQLYEEKQRATEQHQNYMKHKTEEINMQQSEIISLKEYSCRPDGEFATLQQEYASIVHLTGKNIYRCDTCGTERQYNYKDWKNKYHTMLSQKKN